MYNYRHTVDRAIVRARKLLKVGGTSCCHLGYWLIKNGKTGGAWVELKWS